MSRQGQIKLLHVAKRELGLDDDTYRATLRLVTGKESSKELDHAELKSCIAHMKGLGFKPKSNRARKSASPIHAFARALWISLHQLGAIDDPQDTALDAFVLKQTGLAKPEWVNSEDMHSVIEALKDMCARHGYVLVNRGNDALANKRNLIVALMAKLDRNIEDNPDAYRKLASASSEVLTDWAKDLGKEVRRRLL